MNWVELQSGIIAFSVLLHVQFLTNLIFELLAFGS